MANEVLMTISKDEIERARALSALKYELDMQDKIATAFDDGIEKVKMEITEMLKNGKTPEEIIKNYSRL